MTLISDPPTGEVQNEWSYTSIPYMLLHTVVLTAYKDSFKFLFVMGSAY